MKRSIRVCCFVIFLLVAFSTTLHAQSARLTGGITDGEGHSVSGASIAVTNVTTGVKRITQTGDTGVYDIAALPSGQYDIRVEKAGFAVTERAGITLTVDTTTQVDIQLSIQHQESVVVHGDASMLQRDVDWQHTRISPEACRMFPVNDPHALVILYKHKRKVVRHHRPGPAVVLRTANQYDRSLFQFGKGDVVRDVDVTSPSQGLQQLFYVKRGAGVANIQERVGCDDKICLVDCFVPPREAPNGGQCRPVGHVDRGTGDTDNRRAMIQKRAPEFLYGRRERNLIESDHRNQKHDRAQGGHGTHGREAAPGRSGLRGWFFLAGISNYLWNVRSRFERDDDRIFRVGQVVLRKPLPDFIRLDPNDGIRARIVVGGAAKKRDAEGAFFQAIGALRTGSRHDVFQKRLGSLASFKEGAG